MSLYFQNYKKLDIGFLFNYIVYSNMLINKSKILGNQTFSLN